MKKRSLHSKLTESCRCENVLRSSTVLRIEPTIELDRVTIREMKRVTTRCAQLVVRQMQSDWIDQGIRSKISSCYSDSVVGHRPETALPLADWMKSASLQLGLVSLSTSIHY